ncbi:beta-galactosidase [Prevotella sp. CAG:1185]|nr:beta-galactosidase [Prevotella sp. CAG:1185]
MGAGMNRKAKVWNNPEMKLTSLTVEKGKKVEGADEKCPAVVVAKYDMPAVKATLTLTYAISADGSMKITEKMDATEGEKVPTMFRFGMLMQMPYGIDRSTFYGRGPIENYADRKESQNVGIYSQTADEQFFPYIRPQENGTKSDLRWWRQTDANGFGLEVSNAGLFSASALHYNIEDLDDGDDKEQRHSPQVPKSKFTNLIIDMAQTGVGGVDSWSMNGFALPKYRVEYGDKEFTFVLKPLK